MRVSCTDEVAVYEMRDTGLVEVENPGMMFLQAHGDQDSDGSAVAAAMEGSRPIMVEVQVRV